MIDRELLAQAIWGDPPRRAEETWEAAGDGAHAHFRRRADGIANNYEALVREDQTTAPHRHCSGCSGWESYGTFDPAGDCRGIDASLENGHG